MAGRDRKNSIKALFGDSSPLAPEAKMQPAETVAGEQAGSRESQPDQRPAEPANGPARAASGAVKAMGLSLSSIAREAEEARQLRQALEEGERVISLSTERIEASFVQDRLSNGDVDDPQFAELIESIRESGQQVPILVRPHPEHEGRFQVAYGHRRLRAAQALGVEVKALVRTLSDDELVVAQGKENAERRNLSFIERALFAKTLATRGFDRKLIGDALAVQKSELSRLIQVADGLPDMVIRAIGPAPKAGRDRWMKMVELLSAKAAMQLASDEITQESFRTADSDRRFELLFGRLAQPVAAARTINEPLRLTAEDGRSFAEYRRQGRTVKIDFAKDADPAFLDQLSELLRSAYAAHVKTKH
ncbi:plasmid partitioning protein RepB [Rhizobium sp. G187]|uniref:plasmid partitioning protein RepB n=1 Tax=Rhizobium sp. G187 TaxID=3451352 RepID=UPI003EE7B11C